MSVYGDPDIVRLDGELMAYVRVQNDYTGQVIGGLRKLHLDGNEYYIKADGRRVNVTKLRETFLDRESKFSEFCKQEGGIHGRSF